MRNRKWKRDVQALALAAGMCLAPAAWGDEIIHHLQDGEPATLSSLTTGSQLAVDGLDGDHVVAGKSIRFSGFSGVIGQSADAAYILVAKGSVRAGNSLARAGRALIILPHDKPVNVARYDAKRFVRSWPQAAIDRDAGLHGDFADLAKQQKWGLFFGRYAPTQFNLVAPGSAAAEMARRSVYGQPVISEIRFSDEKNAQAVEKRVVDTFTRALAAGDVQTVAALMDPSPFGEADLRDGGSGARLLMAQNLLSSANWAERLAGAEIAAKGEDNIWQVKNGRHVTEITLKPMGDFAFIQSIHTGA